MYSLFKNNMTVKIERLIYYNRVVWNLFLMLQNRPNLQKVVKKWNWNKPKTF